MLKGFLEGLPLFKLIFSFLKLKRVLKKIDISCVKSQCQTHPPTRVNLTQTVGRFDM